MITSALVNFLGTTAFLFFFWRRLREDYTSNQIFSTATFMLLGFLLGFWLSRSYFPSWWFWTEGLGITLGLLLGIFRFKFRFHESLEAAGVSFLPWIAFMFLKDSTEISSLASLIGFLVSLLLIGLFYILDVHYKKFTWYRSGRVGFAGISTMGLFFLIRALVGAFYPSVLSFSGRFDAIVSGIVAFLFFLVIYNLSRQSP